jgi:hypothetical protein
MDREPGPAVPEAERLNVLVAAATALAGRDGIGAVRVLSALAVSGREIAVRPVGGAGEPSYRPPREELVWSGQRAAAAARKAARCAAGMLPPRLREWNAGFEDLAEGTR